ncbi:MAG TPA: carboxypeptidase regulatory-like domain-containing protein [Kofleriaceae bacterium]|nr:carboxypeptidase regulatory-like domain-containing protein [Kofleriaceae bacterium]
MSLSRSIAFVMLAAGFLACKGDTGDKGDKGDPGDPGGPVITTGTLTGTVSDGVKGDPLAGVVVTAQDAGGGSLGSVTTGADGTFSLVVAAGPVDLVFDKELYTSPGVLHAGVNIGQTVSFAVTMNESASGKPSVSLAAGGDDFGYGVSVPLTASAADPNGDPLTFTWVNATWPVLGAVTGDSTSGTATMPTLAEAFAYRADSKNPGQFISGYVLPDRFGIVPITTDTRGQMTASLIVADGRGQSTTASITLNAASVSAGMRNVVRGQRIYLNSGHDGDNAWTLGVPEGSTAVLDDATLRTPSFVADVDGVYTVSEGASSTEITAGMWRGIIAGGEPGAYELDLECVTCHQNPRIPAPDMFTPWQQTGHATMFAAGLNGDLSDHYSGACVGCHTVGFDPGVAGTGFDDAARAEGWSFPGTFDAANWTNLVQNAPAVARLANIQCESCHGPQLSKAHITVNDAWEPQPFLSPRISYSSEACATCHGAGAHHIYSEWATPAAPNAAGVAMGHSNRDGAKLGAGATGLNSHCGRCHSAQGYTLYADILKLGKVTLSSVPTGKLAQVTSATVEAVTCVACHDPHDATNPNQLRFFGDTPNLPAGFAGHGMGKGALCLTCHNSRNGAQTGSDTLTYLHEDGEPYNEGNPTGFSAPHQAAQGDVFAGHNAYFMGSNMPMTSRHAAIEDTCVGCHMTLQPKGYISHGAPARSGHLFRIESGDKAKLCANCHGGTVDGEGIQAQVEAQLERLDVKMSDAFKAKMNGFGVFRVRAWDEATDYYSSTSTSNVVINPAVNPIVSVKLEEIHGQVGLLITLRDAIEIPFVTGAGAPAPSKTTATFGVQLGAVKDNAATPVAVYSLTGNFVRAGWNYFLIEGDQSKGLHNPSFVTAVLNNTLAKNLSY